MRDNLKQYVWHKIANHIDELAFAQNDMALVEVEGRALCICRFKGSFYAVANKCPHASALFTDGYIDAHGNVVCPLHSYKFSIQTGRNTSGEGYYLRHWPVELREDGIFVGL